MGHLGHPTTSRLCVYNLEENQRSVSANSAMGTFLRLQTEAQDPVGGGSEKVRPWKIIDELLINPIMKACISISKSQQHVFLNFFKKAKAHQLTALEL
jgi:hypothetical protein